MELSALEVEGVGPFAEPLRLGFGPGTLVLLGGNESGKSTLLELIALLLDPDPELEGAPLLRASPPPERSRATLALRDAEGELRIAADLEARCLRLEPGEGAPLAGPAEAVCEALRARLRLPRRGLYGRLFTSRGERVGAAVRAGRLREVEGSLEARAAGLALRALRTKVEALRTQLVWAQERQVQDARRETEAARLAELEGALADTRQVRETLADLERELAASAPLGEAPADIAKRAADYERLAAELGEAEAALLARESGMAKGLRALARPARRRRAGLAGALVWIAVSLALAAPSWIPGLAIAAPGLALLAVGAVEEVRAWRARARLRRGLSEQGDRTRVLRHRFEFETSLVRGLAQALGLSSPAELPAVIARRRELLARRDGELESLVALGEPERLEQEIGELRSRLAAVPAAEPAHAAEDLEQLRLRVEAAERELRAAERDALEAAVRASAELAPAARLVEELLEAAAALAGSVPEAAWADAEELAGAYLRALTLRRYAGIRRKGEGQYLLEREARSPLALEDAADSAAEALHAAVQLALVERTAPRQPLPLLLDEPFVRFDTARRRGAARAVRRLGAVTQVLLATADPLFAESADHVVRLGG